ncbi:MAG TPA: twin-arginine translocase TatA/TatE family subunit [Candidatus Acidoferrales bacterium]|jgi:sec-independent protein translocase protein TatA|nr:twin-arginine translocase TatA/TatE family subunit [Candidatus Acidoferrales bacterium]
MWLHMGQHAVNLVAILDSPMDIAIVVLVVLILFGGKKIPEMMRGIGSGIKEFKQGMRDEPAPTPSASTTTTPPPVEPKK